MFRHIMIATDGSELAGKAVTQGLELAQRLGAKVSAVTVTEPWTAYVGGDMGLAFPVDDYDKGCADSAGKILADVSAQAAKAGLACNVVHVKERQPAEGIVEAAQARGADLIIMASHGRRGVARLLLGSQSAACAHP